MSAERDVNRIVRSWLSEDEHESADAILGIVLSRLDTTPQRRSWWPARRLATMNNPARIAIAAAAVILVAVVGYQFLPARLGPGGSTTAPPTVAPSPTPALLAKGSFIVGDGNTTELDATLTGGNVFASPGDRTDVAGTMTVLDDGRIAVDLDCARMGDDGVLVIGGTVSESTQTAFPQYSLFAIILQRGTPVRAGFMFGATSEGPCMSFISGGLDASAIAGLRPIEGNVALRP